MRIYVTVYCAKKPVISLEEHYQMKNLFLVEVRKRIIEELESYTTNQNLQHEIQILV